jgi:hypothetical protein
MRHPIALLCLAATALAACGGANPDDARKAAEAYVRDLGRRDGHAVCNDMTKALQRQFTVAVTRANPEVRGQGCGDLMDRALASLPNDQLERFAAARIEQVKVDGSKGSFTYRLGAYKVDGQVAEENDRWKVSCCVQW